MTSEQREALIGWIAADYSEPAIRKLWQDRGWEQVSGTLIDYYRKQLKPEIEAARKARHESALNRGLALKEERVARLSAVAEEVELVIFERDGRGRFKHLRDWRELMNDIAAEMGHRRPGAEEISAQLAAMILDDLQKKLEPEVFAVVFRALHEGRAAPGPQPEGPHKS